MVEIDACTAQKIYDWLVNMGHEKSGLPYFEYYAIRKEFESAGITRKRKPIEHTKRFITKLCKPSTTN